MPIRDSKLDPIAGYAAGALVGEVGQLKNGELSIDTDVKAVAAIAAALSVFARSPMLRSPRLTFPSRRDCRCSRPDWAQCSRV